MLCHELHIRIPPYTNYRNLNYPPGLSSNPRITHPQALPSVQLKRVLRIQNFQTSQGLNYHSKRIQHKIPLSLHPSNTTEDKINQQLFITPYTPEITHFLPQNFNSTNLPESTDPIPDTTDPSPPPYIVSAKKLAGAITPVNPTRIIHYGHERYHQLRVNISHRATQNPPEDTQGWIEFLCHYIMAEFFERLQRCQIIALGKHGSQSGSHIMNK